MNAQGVAVEKHHWRPIMASLHGMFSLGAMLGAGATGLIATLGIGAPAASARDRRADGRGRRRRLPADAAGWPPRAARRGPASRGLRSRLLLPGLVALAGLLSEGAIGDWSAVYLSASLGAGTTMAAAAVRRLLAGDGGRPVHRRPAGRQAGRRSGGAGGRRARGLRARPHAAIGEPAVAVFGFGLVGAGLSCVFPVVLSSAARTPGVAPSAAIAAVCTVGYVGFLIGPPAIGGLAELIGLPRALGLVVLLCALIAALGSRPPGSARA